MVLGKKKYSKQTKKISYLEKFKSSKEWKIVIAPKIFEYKIIEYIINHKNRNILDQIKEISERKLEVSLSELINDYSSYYKIIKLQPYTINKMFIKTIFNGFRLSYDFIFSMILKPTKLVEFSLKISTLQKRNIEIFVLYTVTKNLHSNSITYGKRSRIREINRESLLCIKKMLENKPIDFIYKVCCSDVIGNTIKRRAKSKKYYYRHNSY
mmetsp:Transcript_30244/g.42159  ORF Transcript_30244/g.42159 Transcript_30244/m.42159 type:complete len:211 (+) Transcript_30244:1687-2319(+)